MSADDAHQRSRWPRRRGRSGPARRLACLAHRGSVVPAARSDRRARRPLRSVKAVRASRWGLVPLPVVPASHGICAAVSSRTSPSSPSMSARSAVPWLCDEAAFLSRPSFFGGRRAGLARRSRALFGYCCCARSSSDEVQARGRRRWPGKIRARARDRRSPSCSRKHARRHLLDPRLRRARPAGTGRTRRGSAGPRAARDGRSTLRTSRFLPSRIANVSHTLEPCSRSSVASIGP